MDKILMTSKGYRTAQAELKRLQHDERPDIIEAISEARAHGDLSENAEYHAAKERQSLIEGRINELAAIVGRAEVVDVTSLSGPIKFGATVTLEDDDNGERRLYQLVSEFEADIARGLLNIASPLARAMIGKGVDDNVEFRAPGGSRSFTVVLIEYV